LSDRKHTVLDTNSAIIVMMTQHGVTHQPNWVSIQGLICPRSSITINLPPFKQEKKEKLCKQ